MVNCQRTRFLIGQFQVSDKIFTLLELMNYRRRWDPVDELIKLGGVATLLQVRLSEDVRMIISDVRP